MRVYNLKFIPLYLQGVLFFRYLFQGLGQGCVEKKNYIYIPNFKSMSANSYDSELRIPVSSGISGMDDLELVEELLLNNLFIILD